MRTSSGDVGLALVRLDKLDEGTSFTCGETTLTPLVPDWVQFQAKEDA